MKTIKITIKVLSIILIILTVIACISCESTNSNHDIETSEKTKENKEELAYAHAKELASQGKYLGASKIFYDIKGYKDSSELAEKYDQYYEIECYLFRAIDDLKSQLKDPYSLVIYDFEIYEVQNGDFCYYKAWLDYGAKNSFGGMVRNTYMYPGNETTDRKAVSTYFIVLSKSEMCKMDLYEYQKWSCGDFRLYHRDFIGDEGNIWRN